MAAAGAICIEVQEDGQRREIQRHNSFFLVIFEGAIVAAVVSFVVQKSAEDVVIRVCAGADGR